MTDKTTNKPDFNIVKFYGEGENQTSGRVGAIWVSDKGHLNIMIENPLGSEKIILTAFPTENSDQND